MLGRNVTGKGAVISLIIISLAGLIIGLVLFVNRRPAIETSRSFSLPKIIHYHFKNLNTANQPVFDAGGLLSPGQRSMLMEPPLSNRIKTSGMESCIHSGAPEAMVNQFLTNSKSLLHLLVGLFMHSSTGLGSWSSA